MMRKNWFILNINKKYFLKVGNKFFGCQIGAGGLKNAVKKVEGDKATPIGKWYFKSLYYRSDRVVRPKFNRKNILKIYQIKKHSGWCDDISSYCYNKYISLDKVLSRKISYENLWRQDNVYDLILTISHNLKPTIKNKGSAIFIHCSFSDNRKTAGCIALKKRDLSYLIKTIDKGSYVNIKY